MLEIKKLTEENVREKRSELTEQASIIEHNDGPRTPFNTGLIVTNRDLNQCIFLHEFGRTARMVVSVVVIT